MKKVLVIQTAFIGDVILATPVIEKLFHFFPKAHIDFLLRKGNEGLLIDHPKINKILIWNKKENKLLNMFRLISTIRKEKYDLVINLQRFASSGIITTFSGAKVKIGFDKNPLSLFFTEKFPHEIGNGTHETERNLKLIERYTDTRIFKPKLYPSDTDFERVKTFKEKPYVCIAPASVWFTKQFPAEKWKELLLALDPLITVYLLGAPGDQKLCEVIKENNNKVLNLAGKLSFLESAALMKDARMNYVNDSAPMHIASAMNAPVTAIFCSTVPSFGFGPVSDESRIVETTQKLPCRPCGLHGYAKCPEGHFNCANTIQIAQLL